MSKIKPGVRILIAPLMVILFCLNACTTIHFNTIAPPPPGGKLRIAIMPLTGDGGKSGWHTKHDQWSNAMFNMVGEHLRDTGVYEVVSQEDMNHAAGKEAAYVDQFWWLKNDSALLKQYGQALYADYAMLITRSANISGRMITDSYKFEIQLINIETGKSFSVSDYLANRRDRFRNREIVGKKIWPALYRTLFSEAKSDLLATAIRKGQMMPAEEVKVTAKPKTDFAIALPAERKPSSVPPGVGNGKKPSTLPKPSAPKDKLPLSAEPMSPKTADDAKSNAIAPSMPAKASPATPGLEKVKLIVYDFDTTEQLKVVSLILAEALREELFRLGNFTLVSRENLVEVLQEFKLQQSGLVDEKQILKLGKWLAANEAVTGRFTQLGHSYILQARRTDITTMSTLGLGSLKCPAGQEEELLNGLPELARKIVGPKK